MTETVTVDTSQPYLLPSARQQYYDPAVELTARNLLASYFGTPDQPGLISQQIPVPIQQVAGLSPLEIQARNLAGGLGAFGGQLAEAQNLYRQAGRGFDPASAGVFGDPQARALYMQSLGAYDPSTGQQFVDPEARRMMTGAAGDIQRAAASIPGQIGAAQRGMAGAEGIIRGSALSSAQPSQMAQQAQIEAARQAGIESDIGQAAMRQAAGGIGQEVLAGQRQAAGQEFGALMEAQELGRTLGGIGREAGAGAAAGEQAIEQAARGIKPQVSAGQIQSLQAELLGMAGAQRLESQLSNIGRQAGAGAAVGQQAIEQAARGIRPEVTGAQRGSLEAVQRARGITGQAGRDLQSAGAMGRATAQQGIAALSGTGGQFDPSSISRFMDPFTQQVIEAEQEEIARLGEKQKQEARSRAVQAGAFGGSRQGIEQAEIGRNILEQQARTGAQLRSQGYQQAAQQAQQAFEQAQGRQQNLAQLTGSLGQAGAGTSLQAAQAAGTLGLSAEELAQSGAMQSGQLGMTGRMNEAQLAEQAASLGMSADQLQAQLANQAQQAQMGAAQMQQSGAMQRAQLGLTGQMNQAQLAEQAAQLGISTDQLRAQLAQQGQAATMGARQMGQQGAIQRAQLGLTGRETEAQLAERAANMGISTEQLRAQLARQGADIAQSQAGIGMQAGQNIGALAGQRGQLGLQGQQAMIGAAGQRADIGQALGGLGMQGQQMGLGAYEDQMRRMQGAAGGLGGLTQQQFGTALQAYGAGTGAQRAAASGIAGLGQQGYDMLTGQIGTLSGLGATGRGIQDRALQAQYTAATQMADEPYMRLQRGQQMLGGLSGYLPTYQSGYSGGMGETGSYQDPGKLGQAAGWLSLAGNVYGFGKDQGWWGG